MSKKKSSDNTLSEAHNATLQEYINLFTNTQDEILFKGFVEASGIKVETDKSNQKKPPKFSKRVIVITKYRIAIFKKGMFNKLSFQKDHALLELKEIGKTNERNVVTLEFPDVFYYIRDDKSGLIVRTVRNSYRQLSVGWPAKNMHKLSIPDEDCEELDVHFEAGPCSGFAWTYKAYCNKRKVPPREDFIQFLADMEQQNRKDLDLTVCPGVDGKSDLAIDMTCLGSSLQNNPYFHSLIMKDVSNKDAMSCVAYLSRFSREMTKIVVRNTGSDCPVEFGEWLSCNSENQLQVIDVSGNVFKVSAIVSFAKSLRSFPHVIKVLNLANCSLPPRGVTAIVHAFKANWGMSLALEEFSISGNKLDDEATDEICNWLNSMKAYSTLRRLAVADTLIDTFKLLESARWIKSLEYLDLSNNKCDKVQPDVWSRFATGMQALRVLKVANCSLPFENAQKLLDGLFRNDALTDLSIDFSGNNFGPKAGSFLAESLRRGNSLHVLNIGSNNLRKSAVDILDSLPPTVTRLAIGDNFSHSDTPMVAGALSKLIERNSALRSLSLVGGEKNKLREELGLFFKSLKTNSTLTELDVTNNSFLDIGMTALTSALRENSTLTSVNCDKNRVTLTGYQAIRQMLNYNKSLCFISYPFVDIDRVASNDRDRLRDLVNQIMRILPSHGEPLIAADPFVFELDWPTPSKPAASLVTVPDELKGQGPPPMPLEITATDADAPRLSLQPTEAEPAIRPRSMTMDDSPSYMPPPPPQPTVAPPSPVATGMSIPPPPQATVYGGPPPINPYQPPQTTYSPPPPPSAPGSRKSFSSPSTPPPPIPAAVARMGDINASTPPPPPPMSTSPKLVSNTNRSESVPPPPPPVVKNVASSPKATITPPPPPPPVSPPKSTAYSSIDASVPPPPPPVGNHYHPISNIGASTPPPPPPPAVKVAPEYDSPPEGGGERNALLSSISNFKKGGLKKAVTNDRSGPSLSKGGDNSGKAAGPMGGIGMLLAGAPKLNRPK
jgi:Ran GTPase-activating protein (RanGAP) involved in mRNA processing and transport